MHYQRDDLCAKSSIKGGLAIIQQHTIRARSNKFSTTSAKQHTVLAQPIRAGAGIRCRHCNFELGKVEIESIRKRMVACLLGWIVSWPRGADRGGFQPPCCIFLTRLINIVRLLAPPTRLDVLRETNFGDTVRSNYRDRTSVITAAGVIAGATNQNVKVASAFVEAHATSPWSRQNEAAVPA